MDTKICSKCLKENDVSEFYKHKVYGYRYTCKSCEKKYRNSIKNNEDFIRRNKIASERWRLKHREKALENKKKSYQKHKKRYLEYAKQWRKTPKGREYHIKQIERRRNVIHHFTSKEWENKVKETNGKCPSCGKKFIDDSDITLDHIIPISIVPIGTVYTIDDVQPLCRSCNSKKSDKLVMDFEVIEIDDIDSI